VVNKGRNRGWGTAHTHKLLQDRQRFLAERSGRGLVELRVWRENTADSRWKVEGGGWWAAAVLKWKVEEAASVGNAAATTRWAGLT
jgi:hypothetical protein